MLVIIPDDSVYNPEDYNFFRETLQTMVLSKVVIVPPGMRAFLVDENHGHATEIKTR